MRSEAKSNYQERPRLRKHPSWTTSSTPLTRGVEKPIPRKVRRHHKPRRAHRCLRNLGKEDQLLRSFMTLKPKLFSNSVCKRPLASMEKLRARESSYIQMKEMVEYRDG
ncbi:hypothetical protein CR513_17420, partial [Mucuna pruriens]